MSEEGSYERLLRSLEEMQAQIEERVRPVMAEVVQAEIERLRALSEQHQNHLGECLDHIDESLLSCRDHLHAYQQARSDLVSLNQRLADLGAQGEAIPNDLPTDNLCDIITDRLERLKTAGKI